MREGKFLKQNIERWQTYLQPTTNPDEQASQYTNLIEDLSYSKTFYPNSTTTQFINGLAAKLYISIYHNRKQKSNRISTFFRYEIPYIVGKYHGLYLFTFVFFVCTCLMGAMANYLNPNFVRSILGDAYVDKTLENIDKGDPFNVYKDGNSYLMFLQIAINNLWVGFKVYAGGILLGTFTIYALFQNGIMLGAFEQMFFAKNLGLQSILVVWIHGTIEINALIIEGTAGLILAYSILKPGTFTRKQSLINGAKDSIKIIVVLVPFTIFAAYLESFITRHTEMPIWLSVGILVGSLALIIYYFIILPIAIKRAGIEVHNGEVRFKKSNEAHV